MTGSWWRGLLLTIFFLAAIFLLAMDQKIARDLKYSQWCERTRESTLQVLHDLEKEAESLIQVEKMIKEFHMRSARLFQDGDTPQARRALLSMYQREFRNVLPRHDVGFALSKNFSGDFRMVFQNYGNLTLNDEFLKLLFEGLVCKPEEFSESKMKTLEVAFRKTVGFPISRVFLNPDSGMGLHSFNCWEGRKIFYVQTDPPRTSWRNNNLKSILSFLIDAERLPETFGAKRIVSSWKRQGMGVGFVSLKQGPSYFSNYFSGKRRLSERLLVLAKQTGQAGLTMENPGQLTYVGKPILGGKYRPVVVRSLEFRGPPQTLADQGSWTFSVVAVGLVFLTFLRRWLLGHRPRISVGTLLLGVFSVIVLLPLLGVSGITRFIMAEEERRESNQAQSELHERLKSFDDLVIYFQAGYIQALRKASSLPNLGSLLNEEERAGRDLGLLNTLALQAKKSFSFGEIAPIGGFLLAAGPGNFSRCWTKFRKSQTQNPEDIANFLVPIMHKALNRLQQGMVGRGPLGIRNDNVREETGNSKDGIRYEIVREMFIKLMSPDSFFTLLYFPARLRETITNLGRVSFIQFRIRFEGKPRYLLNWVWDETSVRQACLDFFRKKIPREHHYRVFLTIAREFGFRHQPEGLDRIPALFETMVRCRDSGAEIQKKIPTTSGQIILESTPSTQMPDAFFSGIRFLSDTTIQTRIWFRKTLFLGVLLAIFLSAAATMVFMFPLRRLMGAIQSIRSGQLDTRLADDQRRDEFGTLALAFNSMAKGLREKELLNRYVSPSVRRMISDPAFFQAARDGEAREVTVLFTGLHEFDSFQDLHPSAEVFQLINDQLGILNAAVEEFGGEISKVIGEKIMVVFDHRDLGSGENAILAAVNVISKIRADFQALPLTPVFGINSGPVIAGILGSPTVRRDYTVIGDTVNLASRLASLAHTVGRTYAVISGSSRELAVHQLDVEILPVREVKGKTQAVKAFLLNLPDGQRCRESF
jgi:class 3 adenylate cyclase